MATASAQSPGVLDGKQKVQAAATQAATANLSPKQRGELTRQFVNKWGLYVQRVYNVPVNVWAKRMVSNFVVADAANFRNALKRETYEGAMAELSGSGHRISDTQVVDRLARVAPGEGANMAKAVAAKLGDLNRDLVYTPVQPCRILDTRSTAAGAIAANSTRNFVAFGVSSFASQGGSATNCGVNPLAATAVAINLTAVTPSIAGYATAYPFGTAQPVAASINYTAGAIVNNALIVQTPNPISSFDFTVYTFGQSHFVADIVGYFAPPQATDLQCVETANADLTIAGNGGTGNATAPACPTGYTQTSTNCETTSWQMPIVYFQSGVCSARNGDTTSQTLRASRTCCRVPGR
ncbi:MAG: hypothetical protein IT473_03345 [Lysobacter sp.]|nr:hypothetical protein [Lysobacter sp.]